MVWKSVEDMMSEQSSVVVVGLLFEPTTSHTYHNEAPPTPDLISILGMEELSVIANHPYPYWSVLATCAVQMFCRIWVFPWGVIVFWTNAVRRREEGGWTAEPNRWLAWMRLLLRLWLKTRRRRRRRRILASCCGGAAWHNEGLLNSLFRFTES